jgi:hypothetical protein
VGVGEKVNKQVRASRLRDSVARAKLRDSVQRIEERKARDSLFRAFGAGQGSATRRRVVIVEPRPSPRWPDAEQIGRAVADSLRSMLAKRSYLIVNPDSVRALRQQFNTVPELANALSSELLISIRINERPPRRGTTGPDSVMMQISAYDLTARSPYNQRTVPLVPAWTAHEEILGGLESLLLQTVGAVDEMSRAPRKAPGTPETPGLQPMFPFGNMPGRTIEIRPNPPKKPPLEK